MQLDLSIVIPCYRESNRLPITLMRIHKFLQCLDLRSEIILVIEPSPDDTLEVAEEWQKKIQGIRIIQNPYRLGKGGSVRQGVLQAEGEYICFMDADGATDLTFFYEAYQTLRKGKAKVAIASRGIKDSVILTKQGRLRQRLGLAFRWITKSLMGLPYEDTQCGAKMFHQETVASLFDHLREYGFAFDVEILLKARLRKIPVIEMPCVWEDVDGSTVHPMKDGWKMLQALIKVKLYYILYRREIVADGSSYLPSNGTDRERPLVV